MVLVAVPVNTVHSARVGGQRGTRGFFLGANCNALSRASYVGKKNLCALQIVGEAKSNDVAAREERCVIEGDAMCRTNVRARNHIAKQCWL